MKLVDELIDVGYRALQGDELVVKIIEVHDGQLLAFWFDNWAYKTMHRQTEVWIPSTWTVC
jgi:hypothetical protein